ncbi:MAG: phage integrase SAM-like domain-containing protein [Clostridium sp.]
MKKGEKVGKAQFKISEKKQKPFLEVAEEYCTLCQRKGLSPYTMQGYKYTGKYFNNFNKNNLITVNSIIDYIEYLQSENTKWTTINSYVRRLTPIFNWAYDMGYYPKVKVIEVKGQKEMKEVYTTEELKLLLERPKTKDFRTIRNWVMSWIFTSI